jgi:GTPase
MEIQIQIINKIFPEQKPECYSGNKEYKCYWNNNIANVKKLLNKRATQMLYRLYEGHGRAIYILGISDNGIPDGINENKIPYNIDCIKKMCEIIDATIVSIRIYNTRKNEKMKIITIRITKDLKLTDATNELFY